MRRNEKSGALQKDLEERIRNGSCVYCRAPAAPDRPLTREHVIPQARGGRRKDLRIIVPACARCNHRRGCQEIVLFLLARPRRLTVFLDYLGNLPPDAVRHLDPRIFAELYAAVWLLCDSTLHGAAWRERLRHLCAGRRLHRRRYAARRIVTAVGTRLERGRDRAAAAEGPSCLLPHTVGRTPAPPRLDQTLGRALTTLVGTLSLAWDVSAERVLEELERERERTSVPRRAPEPAIGIVEAEPVLDEEWRAEADGVLSLDGWKRRRGRRRRARVDQRGGRGSHGRGRHARGRAA
ncbi:MAG TPA: HNH endonuclease [Longimicrobium sp.]|nr:HNH endonuclease [Longimicrobium sp.]